MKRIVIMNCITISLIVILSYISTPNNQILANHHLITGFGSVIAFMSVLWIVSLLVKDASIVDIFWGPAFIVLGSSLLVSMDQVYSERSLFILFLVSLWAIRLASHIGFRNIGHGEDFRYVEWRKESGKNYWWHSFIRVFLLQGGLCTLVGVSIYFGYLNEKPLSFIETMFSSTIFFIGLAWESISDLQLKAFRKNPKNKGKICKSGLWKYSRHPNYFGDSLFWWGITIYCFALSNNLLIFIAPIIMTYLLLRVSGVTMLENRLSKKKDGYTEYINSTSSFIIMPKRKSK